MYLNRLCNKLFLYSTWNIPDFVDCDIVFFQSLDRNDYNNFTDTIISSLNQNIKYEYIKISAVKSFHFAIFEIPLKEHLRIIQDLPKDIGFFGKLFIYASIIQQLGICKKLRNYNVKMVVTHADMQPVENILIQYFKNIRHIPTATLQHGLYIDYTTLPNMNEVNYKNVVSDYFLSRGEETKLLIEHYNKNTNVVICGNPTLKSKTRTKSDFFTVVFDQQIYAKYNNQLFEIAKELSKRLSIKMKVKLHPGNVLAQYNIEKEYIFQEEDIYSSLFILGHTTTMMFELMRSGIPVYKYKTSIPFNKINANMIFEDIDDLIYKITNPENIDYEKESEFYVKYIDKDSLEKYNKFFEKVVYAKD
jgi:hypothetical protein